MIRQDNKGEAAEKISITETMGNKNGKDWFFFFFKKAVIRAEY